MAARPLPGAPTCWLSSQGRWWEAGGVHGRESGPAPSEETPQQPTLERLHQRGLPRPRVAEQFEFDSWLEILRGPELLDEESSVCVLEEGKSEALSRLYPVVLGFLVLGLHFLL